MAPIRVALIGLSASAKTGWAAGGHLPYLTSDRGRKQYKIAALLNSSVDAAKKAIEAFDLGSDVKAYGKPQELADDPDIQLAVAVTRVDVHYDTIKPSVAAGKDAFVEWPLAENAHRAGELADLAKQKGIKTLVGIQARVSPAVLKIKELIHSGKIGKVLSSQVSGCSPYVERYRISEGLSYFLDKKIGGNPMSIGYAHMIDFVHSVLGEFKTFDSHVQLQRPQQTVYNKETGAERSVTSDVPDLVSVHGALRGSEFVIDGASLVASYKPGPPWPGSPALIWTITGEKGEIRLSNQQSASINAGAGTMVLEIHSFDTGKVDEIPWQYDDHLAPLGERGRNIGKLYDLYAQGKLEEYNVASFDKAVARHKEIDAILYE